jgi:hypothetical protein
MTPESLNEPAKRRRGDTVAAELRRRLNLLVVIQILIAIALGGVVWYFAVQAASAHDALCNLRGDQVRRLVTTQDFLSKHPHGVQGISRATFEQQIRNSKQVIKALDDLGCPAAKIG